MDIRKGEPIILPDGTTILPNPDELGRKVVTAPEAEFDDAIEDALEDPFDNGLDVRFKRTLADITIPMEQMNFAMLVVGYTLWGLEPFAIARIFNVPTSQIEHMISSELFTRVKAELLEALRFAETGTIHGFLAQHALKAAKKVATIATNMKAPLDLQLAASKDVLDRAGFRPVDRVEHVLKGADELRIVRIVEEKTPTITVDYERMDNGNGS